jgi:hypothetical protein
MMLRGALTYHYRIVMIPWHGEHRFANPPSLRLGNRRLTMKRFAAAVALAAVAAMAAVQPADARDGRHRGSRTTTTIIQGGNSGIGAFGLNGGVDLGTALLLGALTSGGSTGLTAFGGSGVNPLMLLLAPQLLSSGQTTIIEERSGRRHHHHRRSTTPVPALR